MPQKGCSQRAWGPGIIVTGNKRREYPPEEHEIIEHVISSVLCAANPDILDGLQLYFNEMDIRAMYLVDNTLGAVELPVSVHGFREHQAHHLNDMGHYLHNDWLLKTVAMIENLPKNLHVVHDIHVQRMERIMKLMSLLMTDQIRTVVLQTVRAFSKLWATYKPDPMDGRVTAKMPLFQIHLELMESSMEFLPSLQVMEETVMYVFDSILQSVEEIEDISSKLTKVPMSSVSYLNTVSPEEDEVKVVSETTSRVDALTSPVFKAEDVLRIQSVVRKVPVADSVVRYAVRLAASSRPGQANAPDFVNEWINWGAGLRAGQALIIGAKARALLQGRSHVTPDDVKALAVPVLRHRILPNFKAEAEGVDADQVIAKLVETVPVP